jgi:hypothetical protein
MQVTRVISDCILLNRNSNTLQLPKLNKVTFISFSLRIGCSLDFQLWTVKSELLVRTLAMERKGGKCGFLVCAVEWFC